MTTQLSSPAGEPALAIGLGGGHGRRARWVFTALGVGLLVWVTGMAAVRRGDAARLSRQASSGAFVGGGVPRRDAVLDAAFAGPFATYIARLDDWSRLRADPDAVLPRLRTFLPLEVARRRLLLPDTLAALGEPGATHFARVLRLGREVVDAGNVRAAELAMRALHEELGALADALAARNLGYVLDAEFVMPTGRGRPHLVMTAFAVERVVRVGDDARALWVRRLDQLDVEQRLWGATRPYLRDPLVYLDELETSLVDQVLPALAPLADLPLADVDALLASSPWSQRASGRVGELARAELRTVLADEGLVYETLATTVGQRHRLVLQIMSRALDLGLVLQVPRGLRLPERWLARAERAGFGAEVAQLRHLDALVVQLGGPAALVQLRDVMAWRVARHEAHHVRDAARPAPLPLPAALEALTGPLRTGFGRERREVAQARDELSAYLRSLAEEEDLPCFMLALLVRSLWDSQAWGTPTAAAAAVVIDALASELDLPDADLDSKRIAVRGPVRRAWVTERYLQLAAVEPERLARAASRAWTSLFERALDAR